LTKIYNSLHACEQLSVPLASSNNKHVFTDLGKRVTYACVGPQASRNSQKVLSSPSFMSQLPNHHWNSLVWLMRRAEEAFNYIVDHQAISLLHHAKMVVPFKTFTSTIASDTSSAKYFGGIAFGTNISLHCHTNADFTMRISQVFVKGKLEYHLHDDVIVYFCFPTLGDAVPLRAGDYLMFNPLIPYVQSINSSLYFIALQVQRLDYVCLNVLKNSNCWAR
jgi:hypothetical protein